MQPAADFSRAPVNRRCNFLLADQGFGKPPSQEFTPVPPEVIHLLPSEFETSSGQPFVEALPNRNDIGVGEIILLIRIHRRDHPQETSAQSSIIASGFITSGSPIIGPSGSNMSRVTRLYSRHMRDTSLVGSSNCRSISSAISSETYCPRRNVSICWRVIRYRHCTPYWGSSSNSSNS